MIGVILFHKERNDIFIFFEYYFDIIIHIHNILNKNRGHTQQVYLSNVNVFIGTRFIQ